MATILTITPFGVTEPAIGFTHTAISQMFSRLNITLATYIECERDIDHVDSFDPAFSSWIAAAEDARSEIVRLSGLIAERTAERPEDRPLQRSAMLCRALIDSANGASFTALHQLLSSHDDLFNCSSRGRAGHRVRQMLQTCHRHFDTMAELGEFDAQPAEVLVEDEPVPLTVPAI